MVKTLFALILALTITVTWISMSAAQQPMTGQVLRVSTFIVVPDKRDQLAQIAAGTAQLFAATKSILWFKVGSDPATGEVVSITDRKSVV